MIVLLMEKKMTSFTALVQASQDHHIVLLFNQEELHIIQLINKLSALLECKSQMVKDLLWI